MTSTIDLLINCNVTGINSVSALTDEIRNMTKAASDKLNESNYSAYKSSSSNNSMMSAMQENRLNMTWQEDLLLAGQNKKMQENITMIQQRNELAKIGWEIAEGTDWTYQESLELAKAEYQIRKAENMIMTESLAMAKAGTSARSVNVSSLGEGPFGTLYKSGQVQIEEGNYQTAESFNILATAMEKINFESAQTNGLFESMVSKQEAIIIHNNQLANMTDEQKIALGGLVTMREKSEMATLSGANAEKMMLDISKQAYLNLQTGNYTTQEAVRLATAKITKDYEAVASENAKAEATELSTKAMGQQRMQLMQLSIGMFVLGITTTQTFAALANMVGKTTELGQVFTEMGNSFKLLLGPMQIFLALQQLMIAQNKALLLQAMPVMLFFGSLYLLWKAFTTESPKVRAALGAIGGALMGLTAIMMYNTWAKWQNTIADLANKSIATGGAYLPAGLAIIAGAIAGGVALMATMPKAQTVDGYLRPINRTGIFYGHKGETVGRVGSMTPTTNNRSVVVNIHVASGGSLDRGMIPQLSREIEMAVASGNGV